MFYTQEDVKRIEKELSIIHSSERNNLSLCQYKDMSCVRCCLPHIGGDSYQEGTADERSKLFNKSNAKARLKYGDKYVGPDGVVMLFRNYHPLKQPCFATSHYEDSFADVGKEEMDRRFSQRREFFANAFDPKNPKATLEEFAKKIKEEEGYKFDPSKEGLGGALASMFGFPILVKNQEKGTLPECQLLGFLNEEKTKAGCLAHPLSEYTKGFDGRQLEGFFKKTDSCTRCSCYGAEEFPYLSDSALKAFDKYARGKSWYEYSRHSTAVLVGYLRSFDHVIQQIDERGKLDSLPLEKLVKFTNNLFKSWPLKDPQISSDYNINQMRLPLLPVPGLKLSSDFIEWFSGDRNQLKLSRSDQREQGFLNEVPSIISSTEKGYVFEVDIGHGKETVFVDVNNGNRPSVRKGTGSSLWRANLFLFHSSNSEKKLINHIGSGIRYEGNIKKGALKKKMSGPEILSIKSLPIKERLLYYALDSIFFRGILDEQLHQARSTIEQKIEESI